jgi:mono/diheme cytochrome c family protein
MANRVGVCLAGWMASILIAGCVPGVDREEFFPPPGIDFPRTTGPQPSFGRPRTDPSPPPPISGGTLAALRDGETAVAADPDRDRIFVADYARETLLAELPLEPGDEPGRVIEDADGRVHVALRRGGSIITLARDPWRIAGRRPVCPAPRGLAQDSQQGLLHVACADGQLVSLAPEPAGAVVRRLQLDPDLRDVVVDGEVLLVSRFRSAEVLTIDRGGAVVARQVPPDRTTHRFTRSPDPRTGGSREAHMVSSVAWRLVGLRPGQAVLLHQRALDDEVGAEPGGYGGNGCSGGVVESAVSGVGPLASPNPGAVLGPNVTLAVDLAIAPDRYKIAVVSPANVKSSRMQVYELNTTDLTNGGSNCGRGGAVPGEGGKRPGGSPDGGADAGLPDPIEARQPIGEATAVAYDRRGHLLVQTREPATVQLLTGNRTVLLSRVSREDTGHAIFHANSGSSLACAACHPEALEDGRSWKFRNHKGVLEIRRTQNLSGQIAATAPFHWNGDLKDLGALMKEVFVSRMNGPSLDAEQVQMLGNWIEGVPALPTVPPRDQAAVDRGRELFHSAAVNCASCHAGPLYTNNTTVDVGTGGALQVPSLRGVRWRPPFMHDGCARTLEDRFSQKCGGGDRHGITSRLGPDQIADLIAFMESL